MQSQYTNISVCTAPREGIEEAMDPMITVSRKTVHSWSIEKFQTRDDGYICTSELCGKAREKQPDAQG